MVAITPKQFADTQAKNNVSSMVGLSLLHVSY